MMKKDYQKPSMQVVQIQHHAHLLQTSGPRKLSGPNKSGSGSEDDDWYDLE